VERRHKAARLLDVSHIFVGITTIICALAVPVAFAGGSNTINAGSTSAATTIANAAAIDTSNPDVQRRAHELAREPAVRPPYGHRVVEDHSGRKQVGKASVYAPRFQGRRMANGRAFDETSRAAASKSLPLGTVAKVTNLKNGRTAVVTVEDHGPYVNGRVVDVTNATARQLGINKRQGIAPVVVAPVAVPQANGSVVAGAGAVPGPATGN
jgi:rare lipoprotein A